MVHAKDAELGGPRRRQSRRCPLHEPVQQYCLEFRSLLHRTVEHGAARQAAAGFQGVIPVDPEPRRPQPQRRNRLQLAPKLALLRNPLPDPAIDSAGRLPTPIEI